MALYKLLFRKSFRKDVKKLPKEVATRVVNRVDRLAHEPFPADAQKLKGYEQLYRIRLGRYRVVYAVDTDIKVIALTYARHRKDVYRKL